MNIKIRQKDGKELRASFTVEAAVVVPAALAVIAAVLLAAFYMHDAVIMQAGTGYAVYGYYSGGRDSEVNAVTDAENFISDYLLLMKNASVTATEKNGTYYVNASGSIPIPEGMISEMLGEGAGNVSVSAGISYIDGRKTLLKYKAVCDGIGKLTEEGNWADSPLVQEDEN